MAGKYQYTIEIVVSEHYRADIEADSYEEAEAIAYDKLNSGELECTGEHVDVTLGWTDEED